MDSQNDELIPTRWTLIERLKQWDDERSWKEFFETYWKLIFGVAIKAGLTEVEAQDVVQETVISVAGEIKRFKADPTLGSFKGWLLKITYRRIVDQFRRRRPEDPRSFLALDPGSTTQNPADKVLTTPMDQALETYWEQEWRQTLVEAALDHVKARVKLLHFQIFHLSVIKRNPPREVARALKINIAQIYIVKARVGLLVKSEVRRLQKQGF